MSSVPLVIIAATAREAAAARRALRVCARRRLGAGRCWVGHAAGGSVALVQAGIGAERAAAATRAALEAFQPWSVLVLGFAGALRTGIAPHTLVLAETTQPERGTGWAGDAGLLGTAQAAAAAAGIAIARGTLVSVGELAATPQAKAALAAASGAIAVDMEAAAVAAVAAEAGRPFLSAKVVFDAADERLDPILMDTVRPDGSPRLLYAARLAARDAAVRAALHWAGRRSRHAAAVLTRFCRAFLPMVGAGGLTIAD